MALFQILKPYYKNQQLILVSIYECKVELFYGINQLKPGDFIVNVALTTRKFLLLYRSFDLYLQLCWLQQLISMSLKLQSLCFQNKLYFKYVMLCKPPKYLLKYFRFKLVLLRVIYGYLLTQANLQIDQCRLVVEFELLSLE